MKKSKDNVARVMAMKAMDGSKTAPSLDDSAVALIVSGNSAAAYKTAMKMWFRRKLSSDWTATELTALCDEWYNLTRVGWDGWTIFNQPDVSAVSTGTRGGDNVGMVCVPSTDTVANQDDFAGLPLFAVVDCNWIVDPVTLEPVITAIDGVTDNFERDNPEKYVGVLQQTGYHWAAENDTTYTHGYCDGLKPYANIAPVPEAVRVDGTVRPWVIHGKYMSKTVGGKMSSCAGQIPTVNNSHNSLHTLSAKNGAQYSGGTTADLGWLILMAYIKYASLTLDGILQGCCGYDYQYPAAVSETGVRRVLLTTAQAANLAIGSSVIIGNYSGSKDRGAAAMYSITGNTGAVITKIETVTINGTQYGAVYVDTNNTFDTVANGADATGTTYISTYHWRSGSCDNVLSNDGSPTSCTNGKYPAKLQGIEYMVGGYEVLADIIQNMADGAYSPWIVRRSAQQATSITANYSNAGIALAQPTADSWLYPKKMEYKNGIFYPTLLGGSSSTYLRDGFYANKTGTTGIREYLAFGSLSYGSGFAGLSCVIGNYGLGLADWSFLARLSPNGNRGEFSA